MFPQPNLWKHMVDIIRISFFLTHYLLFTNTSIRIKYIVVWANIQTQVHYIRPGIQKVSNIPQPLAWGSCYPELNLQLTLQLHTCTKHIPQHQESLWKCNLYSFFINLCVFCLLWWLEWAHCDLIHLLSAWNHFYPTDNHLLKWQQFQQPELLEGTLK